MNVYKAILFTLISSLMFAAMSSLVRFLGDAFPVGQVVFFRAAFAIVPVVLIYAIRGELKQAVYTRRPLGHVGRGFFSVGGMFLNFASLARLPIVDATAISFTSPLITVALSAIFLKEHVRLYRWSAVILGFVGVIVMLWQQFDISRYANPATAATSVAAIGAICGLVGATFNAGAVIQTRRLTVSETTPSIVFLFLAVLCAGRARHVAIWLGDAAADAACCADRHWLYWRAVAPVSDRELSQRAAIGGRAVQLFDHVVGGDFRLCLSGRGADFHGVDRRRHRRGGRPVRGVSRTPAWEA